MVNYCNRVSLWVIDTVLKEETVKARAKAKAKFIMIAMVSMAILVCDYLFLIQ